MSARYLGSSFDIHAGGMDLIFPHHENEVAQSRACCGKASFAQYWLHNGFINLRGEKMSKSLGNVFSIREVCSTHEAEALRQYLLGTHYRNPISFDVVTGADGKPRFPCLEEQEGRLAYAYRTLQRLQQLSTSLGIVAEEKGAVLSPADTFASSFHAALADDFNTAAALGYVAEILTLTNRLIDQPKLASKDVRQRTLRKLIDHFALIRGALGLFEQNADAVLLRRRDKLCALRGIDAGEVEEKLRHRNEARQTKNFAAADEVRKELEKMGIEVMDSPSGSTWRVVEEIP
jgi:cysteinyl-tRNA synthetase